MESLTESSSSSKPGFFKHVFNFDSDSKAEMLNIIQYAILALIPIIILNKLMQKYIPEADEEKGSLEISAEVLLQVIIIVLTIIYLLSRQHNCIYRLFNNILNLFNYYQNHHIKIMDIYLLSHQDIFMLRLFLNLYQNHHIKIMNIYLLSRQFRHSIHQ